MRLAPKNIAALARKWLCKNLTYLCSSCQPRGPVTSVCEPQCECAGARPESAHGSTTWLIHVCALDLLHRKPRINSQLVAQQVAQQYPMPPPPKKDRRERSDRPDKERLDGEGERANIEGRPEGERPERVRLEVDTPEKEKADKEQPIKDKPDTEKDISPAVTKKPSSKKTRSVHVPRLQLCLCRQMSSAFILTGRDGNQELDLFQNRRPGD